MPTQEELIYRDKLRAVAQIAVERMDVLADSAPNSEIAIGEGLLALQSLIGLAAGVAKLHNMPTPAQPDIAGILAAGDQSSLKAAGRQTFEFVTQATELPKTTENQGSPAAGLVILLVLCCISPWFILPTIFYLIYCIGRWTNGTNS